MFLDVFRIQYANIEAMLSTWRAKTLLKIVIPGDLVHSPLTPKPQAQIIATKADWFFTICVRAERECKTGGASEEMGRNCVLATLLQALSSLAFLLSKVKGWGGMDEAYAWWMVEIHPISTGDEVSST